MGLRAMGAAALNKVRAGGVAVKGKVGPHFGKAKGHVLTHKKKYAVGGAAAAAGGAGAVVYGRRRKKK